MTLVFAFNNKSHTASMLIILHCMQHTHINPRLYEFSKSRSQTACMSVKQQSNWLFYDKMVHILTTNAPETLIRKRITHLYVLYRLGLSLAASRTESLRSFAPLRTSPGASPPWPPHQGLRPWTPYFGSCSLMHAS